MSSNTSDLKQLSNPFSTGSGGASFEHAVQAKFVTLMLTGGFAPCLQPWKIVEINFQAKVDDYNTDDLVVTVVNPNNPNNKQRLLGQVKHSISLTERDSVFGEVMQAAWADFNNPDVFTKGKDIIALITGPISKTDIEGVRTLLEQARYTKDDQEFNTHINQAKFCSNNVRNKRDAFKTQLKIANNGESLSDKEFYDFLKHFHLLGYDLDTKGSIVSSLLQSHIAQFNKEIPSAIWSQIVCEVQNFNKAGGTITFENIPEEIKNYFKEPFLSYIPSNLLKPPNQKNQNISIDWNNHNSASKLALINLIGSWNEKNEHDKDIIKELSGEVYEDWIVDLREVLNTHDSPLTYAEGIWSIKNRKQTWVELGSRIFDNQLDSFKEQVIKILKINDPAFELPAEQRYAANLYGKILPHSANLRLGVAQTLALLGNEYDCLINCSTHKAENTANLIVRDLLNQADWLLWGTLDPLLPTLSEASPKYFLDAVENAIFAEPSPFDTLFQQEDSGTFGKNYIVGLLWALENLAWEEEFLVRTSVVLAEIASHDPGGGWSNRPSNSLVDIFLPWKPHTLSSVKKKEVALSTIYHEQPQVGWNLIIQLLPGKQTISTGTHKPVWREIFPDNNDDVSNEEYWQFSNYIAELAVEKAELDLPRLTNLIKDLDHLTESAFNQLINRLKSDQLQELSEPDKVILWDELIKFVSHHRKYSDANWSMPEEYLIQLDDVAQFLEPRDIRLLYKHLFVRNNHDLYEGNGSWEDKREQLFERRKNAVDEIYKEYGLKQVLDFAWNMPNSSEIGRILAEYDDDAIYDELIPTLINREDEKKWQLVSSYLWSKRHQQGWQWFDSLYKSQWTKNQLAQALSIFPFGQETWDRAKIFLDKDENLYWEITNAHFIEDEKNLNFVVNNLVKVGRSNTALDIISSKIQFNQSIDTDLACDVLLDLVKREHLRNSIDSYSVTQTIIALQNEPSTNQEKLFQVEWAYLVFLGEHSEASPKTLEHALAKDPNFFCQIMRLVYRPKGVEVQADEYETNCNHAQNAYRLLSNWTTVPGYCKDTNFDANRFKQWFDEVEANTQASGHLDVAMIHIGKVLIYSPQDENGLWIHSAIARTMNERNKEQLRDSYKSATYNSRGAHWVDPEAKPEIELAEKYRKRAEEIENAGFYRLATTLRDLAAWYDDEAKRILKQNGNNVCLNNI